MSTVAIKLKSGTVVDRKKLNALQSAEMQETLTSLYSTIGARIVIVDNTYEFFSKRSLLAALDSNDPNLDLIVEKAGVQITQDDMDIIKKFGELKNRILDAYDANIPAVPYPFQTVPEDWTVDNNVEITVTHVRRKNNKEYQIGLKTLEKLWNKASPWWANGSKANTHPGYMTIQASGYSRDAMFTSNQINIGCQTIQRYELEQIAQHLGWNIPSPAAQ